MSSIHKIPGRCNKIVNSNTAGLNVSYCDRPVEAGEAMCRYHQGVKARRDKRWADDEAKRKAARIRQDAEDARRQLESTACADLSDAEVTAMRQLWDVKEQVKAKLEAALSKSVGEHKAHGCQTSLEIRDDITAALALLDGGGK